MTYKNEEIELERLLSHVLEQDASDLHLVAGKPPMIRVDSKLAPIPGYKPYDSEELAKLIGAVLNEFRASQYQKEKQVDFSYDFKGHARFRVNVYSQKGTWAAALRLITSKIRTIQELNLPEKLIDFTNQRQGLVLFVGPTGHGKSTTLAALIDLVNHTRAEHIATIEDPIEYLFVQDKSIISQREVFQDTDGFAQAIRATLREDVNVVMVGEMRDLESIAAAITVAETGHLVFATLHTNDAPQTVDRIIDVFPSHQQNQIRAQLASILTGIVSQRLLPRIGGGRVPAVEIMISNTAVKNVIREGRTYDLFNIIHTSAEEGMISLDRSLADLVRKGLVKLEDAIPFAANPDLFKSLVKRF